MRMVIGIFLIFLLLSPAAPARAQNAQAASGGARLVQSFGEIQVSDLLARLDFFAIELQNEPALRGFVVAYGARHKFPGWPLRRARFSVDYLVETRGLDRSRLSVVNGGLRAETTFELWVVGPGGQLPVQPFDVSLLMSGVKTPVPYDRFAVAERDDRNVIEIYEAVPRPDSTTIYEHFAEALRRDPGLRGLVVGYAARRGDRRADRRIAARARLAIVRSHAIDVRRLVAMGGGRREYKMIELWLVPPGAELPKPTPERRRARPVRR